MLSQPIQISNLQPDPQNANKGTLRGRGLLERSLRQYGAGRSILTDKNGIVIAGNKTLETAADIGLPVKVVETDGTELVVVQRTDLDLQTDRAARELAYADNRVAQVDLEWDAEQIALDREAGIDVDAFWFPEELDALLEGLPAAEAEQEAAEKAEDSEPQPVIHYDLIFDSTNQQDRFHAFLRYLKARYAEEETTAARLDAFLRETVEE